jgi:hypothetical protein
MANPPPPYDNITGISRAVMKDNAQETLGNYNGNARPGELVVDLTQDPPPLYVGNNSGQLTLVASGGGGYGNTQVAQFLAAGLVGNIIPAGNGVNSLGNSTNYWANLWVANNTIYLGGVPLGMAAGNVLTVNGNAVLQNNSNTAISTTGNITANYFIGNGSQLTGITASANTGNVTFNNQAVVGTGNPEGGGGLYLAPGTESVGNLQYIRVRGGDVATHIHLDTGNNAYFDQYFGSDIKYVKLEAAGNIQIGSDDNTGNSAQWTFGIDGNLTLPLGSIVYETNIPDQSLSGSAIALKPIGGTTANQKLLIYPTANDGDHIHMTSGNLYATELFLGSDNLYVKLANTGNVVINSNDAVGNTAQWNFDYNGVLTLPNGATLNDTSGDSVAFGQNAGNSAQGDNAVAIGVNAGSTTQGQFAVAIGDNAGNNAQGTDAVAIGASAGLTTQGNRAVAIGISAGQTSQGINSIAIGQGAGEINQGNNSIILNATGVALDQTTANTFTVAPVRNDVANIAEVMFYNTTSKEVTYGNVISVAGNITGAYLFGNGSQLTGITASVPSQTILPTIQTITVEARPAGLFGGGQGGANVTVANTIPVTEYGVIITDGTTSEKYKTGSLGSIPGTVSLTFTTGLNSAQFTVFAYVTSNAGTFYSNSATGTSGICLLAGTQIALSNGTHKAIEHITYTDKMLSWDFDRGCYAETTAMWIKRSETGSQYNLLTFSDGTTLRTFDQHRIFNKQAGAFTYPMTDATPVGTITVNEHGQEITLINKQVIVDTIEYYNVITDHHMNLFSNSILTSCRFNNIYPIQDMKFVKDSRPLRSRSEFHQIDDRFFHGLRLAEQQFDLAMIEWYVSRLESLEINTDLAVAV